MTIDVVLDIEPRIQYIASAGQTAFDYPFPIVDTTDISAIVNTVARTDLSVIGAGDDGGGTVTFATPLNLNDQVTLYRNIPISRTSSAQDNGPNTADAFNAEFDRVYMILQQMASARNRDLRLPIDSDATDEQCEFSPLANWLGKLVSIDNNGVPVPALITGTTSLTAESIGELTNPELNPETIVNAIITSHAYQVGNPMRYGALFNDDVGTGADDWLGWQTAINVVTVKGGKILSPAGYTFVGQQLVWQRSSVLSNVAWSGYGTIMRSDPTALSGNFLHAMQVGSNAYGVTIEGVTINHGSDTLCMGAFDCAFTLNTKFRDCLFIGGTATNYAGIRLRNLTPSDPSTGTIRCTIDNCVFYNAVGGYYGVIVRGDANANRIINCSFINTNLAGILIQPDVGQATVANAVTIRDNLFEGIAQYGIWVLHSNTTYGIALLRCRNNRFENGGFAYGFTGATTNDSFAFPFIDGTELVSNCGYMLNNVSGGGLTVNQHDFSVTPFVNPSLVTYNDYAINCLTGNLALKFATAKGVTITDHSNNLLASLVVKSGGGAALVGCANGLSISSTATACRNTNGSSAFGASTTLKVVNLAVAEADTNYKVRVTPTSAPPSSGWWVDTKLVGSFTINSSIATSMTFDFEIYR